MPLWLVFVFTVVTVIVSVYLGYSIGKYLRHNRHNKGDDKPMSIGTVVAASLGLLAFMLAFTFGMTANRYDTRKQLVLDEVNAIGTTYLRANALPEPPRTIIRKILREYVNERVALITKDYWNKPDKIQQLINNAEDKQYQLWFHAENLGRLYPDSEIVGLFMISLNEMIDLHTDRVVVALQYQIPSAIWGALYLLSALTFGLVGFDLTASVGNSVLISIIIALVFSTVIILIADLDRPMQGQIVVSQQPMIDLQENLQNYIP